MSTRSSHVRLPIFYAAAAIILSFSGPALALDDGARTYWKTREGTNIMSIQSVQWHLSAADSEQFAPGQYIYPNADIDADLYIAAWAHHFTLFNRPSMLNVILAGGDIDVEFNVRATPPQFALRGITPGATFSQSSSGFADPQVQLVVNLFGAPALRSGVDLLNYEPTWTLDAAVLLAIPVGEYNEDQLVNIGQNRWYGRIGFPFKYHFGVFTPGYRNSFEFMPSVWLFADNDDFLGSELSNDPLWQLEAHLTHDFTADFYGSLDFLYRGGFQSEIDGHEVGDDLDVGSLGFTLHFQASDNLALRSSYSTNVFGEGDLDDSLIRLQFVYGWHRSAENMRKLLSEH